MVCRQIRPIHRNILPVQSAYNNKHKLQMYSAPIVNGENFLSRTLIKITPLRNLLADFFGPCSRRQCKTRLYKSGSETICPAETKALFSKTLLLCTIIKSTIKENHLSLRISSAQRLTYLVLNGFDQERFNFTTLNDGFPRYC